MLQLLCGPEERSGVSDEEKKRFSLSGEIANCFFFFKSDSSSRNFQSAVKVH